MRRSAIALVLGFAAGCSGSGSVDDDASNTRGGAGGTGAPGGSSAGMTTHAGTGGSGGAGAVAGTGAGAGRGGSSAAGAGPLSGSGGTGGSAGMATGGGGASGSAGQSMAGSAGEAIDYLPLPEGSTEAHGVVNLVSADAVAEVEAFLDGTQTNPYWESSMPTALNMFLEHYVEQYDFLYVYTDHPLPDALAIGRFEPVTQLATIGTGQVYSTVAENVKTNGRLRGVLALQYNQGFAGPIAHETLHNWANYLDLSFGFDQGVDAYPSGHWGYAGVNGELGGFDPSKVACESPADAKPPNCDSFGGGRYRYVVGAFSGSTNGPLQHYGPLENYLMGLVPRAEVPSGIPVFVNGDLLEDSFDQATITMKLEADGMKTVKLDDIVARHGEVKLLPEGQRGFTAAFVVVSATPADDAVLTEVGHWAAVWGGRETDNNEASFPVLTGDAGTMDTKLGPRRRVTDPPPTEHAPLTCDIEAQDCDEGFGCYAVQHFQTACGLSRGFAKDAACVEAADCAPGLACAASSSSASTYQCEPYCDPSDGATNGCSTACANSYMLVTIDSVTVAGLCLAP